MNTIKLQVPCGLPNGQEAAKYFGFAPLTDSESDDGDSGWPGKEVSMYGPLIVTAAFLLFFQVLGTIFFLGRKQKAKVSRARKSKQ